jgi:ribosomal protein L14E/L6E/L27E
MRKYIGRIEKGYVLQCEARTSNGTPWRVINLGEEKAIKEACQLVWKGESEKEVEARVEYFTEINEEEKKSLWKKILASMPKNT